MSLKDHYNTILMFFGELLTKKMRELIELAVLVGNINEDFN
jgi:hypothetical protein